MLTIEGPDPVNSNNKDATSQRFAIATSTWLHLAVLMLICGICFGRSLTSYFIADDFAEIAYVASIFKGHPELFFSNFTGNYMQVPGMLVYRPGMFLTIVLDFLLYGGKAWGYFLSNFLCACGGVGALYFLCRSLSASFDRTRRALFSFFSAALFAANPLHCETITWMVGRGDPYAALFYLLSLLAFSYNVVRPRILTSVCGVVAFVIALSMKELPVGLPFVASTIAFFWGNSSLSLRDRAIGALRLSAPYWCVLVLYFGVRYVCLGTFGGGYSGGVGAQQIKALLQHWTDLDTVARMVWPINEQVAKEVVLCVPLLHALYIAALPLLVIRLLSGSFSVRWTALILAMAVTTAAPIFQLWGLGPNLEGGRFYFFLTIPLSLILPLLFFYPRDSSSQSTSSVVPRSSDRLNAMFLAVSVLIQLAILLLLVRVTAKTDLLWVHAGKEDFYLSRECENLAARIDKQKHILLLGIPDDYHGAHLILNRTMFEVMLRPPFVKDDISGRFITTMPLHYGPEQYLNASRVRDLLSQPDVVGPYVWFRDKRRFQKIDLPSATGAVSRSVSLSLDKPSEGNSEFISGEHHVGQSIFFNHLNLNPLDIDCLEFKISATSLSSQPLKVYWNGSAEKSNSTNGEASVELLESHEDGARTIRIRLGRYWRWYSCGVVNSLEIVPPVSDCCRIENIKLLPPKAVAPTLTFESTDRYTANCGHSGFNLHLSQNSIPGASTLQLEIGKTNYFFDNFPGSNDQSSVATKVPLDLSATSFAIDNPDKYFAKPGYYQLRLHCLNAQGKPVGEYSDAITIIRQ